jgi:hypothetical protein
MLVSPPHVLGIEIRHDRLTRFVDKLVNGIGGIAAGIDGVPDYRRMQIHRTIRCFYR